MRPLKIRVRLALAYTIGLGILLVAWTAALYRTARVRTFRQIDNQIGSSIWTVRPFFNVSSSTITWLHDKKAVEESAYPVAFVVYNEGGTFLDGSAMASIYNLQFTAMAKRAIESRKPTWDTTRLPNGHSVRTQNIPITGSDGRAYLFSASILLDSTEDDLRDLAAALTALIPIALVFAGVAGWWLAADALQPVAQITAGAQRISAVSLSQRLPLRGNADELDQLSSTLNAMMARLQLSFEQMDHFISNVAHELRTPLAALRGSCEIALRSAKSEKECRTVLASNIEELDRLAGTVSELLALARAEAGHIQLDRKAQPLLESVRDTVEAMRPLADERAITLRRNTPAEVVAEVDIQHVLRLLINLIDNAIKYNKPGGWVEVSLDEAEGEVLLSVADSGRGIAPGDVERIFDRFFRSWGQAGEDVGGAGLGLSMVRWVAAAHGGRIEVQSKVGEGSIFRCHLPKTASALGKTAKGTSLVPAVTVNEQAFLRADHEGVVRYSKTRMGTMQSYLVRLSYWIGIGCAAIALVWRALVDLGVPEDLNYGVGRVGYGGFLNAAFLFLLVATATAGYLLVRDRL